MEELLEMITTARVLFSGESALVEVGIPLVIVGDIHGQVIRTFIISLSWKRFVRKYRLESLVASPPHHSCSSPLAVPKGVDTPAHVGSKHLGLADRCNETK